MKTSEPADLDISKAIVQQVHLKEFIKNELTVDVLRLDLIHPVVSGNKWFKLKHHLQEAVNENARTIITYGGAWSNHIVATACFTRSAGLNSVGIIRGEQPQTLSNTLRQAKAYGMELRFVNRSTFANESTYPLSLTSPEKSDNVYIIPQGGAGMPGIKGSMEILSLTDREKYAYILCCIGTGTMYAGIANALSGHQELTGIAVLKGMKDLAGLDEFVSSAARAGNTLRIIGDYHFGGYAKKTSALIDCMNSFYAQTGIPTDFVYTGKLIYAVRELAEKNHFASGSNVLVIHSGGLQGNNSLSEGTLIY